MGEDLSTGIKIAITMIILVSIIGIVFTMLSLFKNSEIDAAEKVQNGLYGLRDMSWDDYNLKTVTGNSVQVMLKTAKDNGVAIIVNNKRSSTAPINAKYGINYGVLIEPFRKAVTVDTGISMFTAGKDPKTTETYGKIAETSKDTLIYDSVDNCYRAFPILEGTTPKYNTNVRYCYDRNSPLYINPNHSYNATLIKDPNGTIFGVYFEEKE